MRAYFLLLSASLLLPAAHAGAQAMAYPPPDSAPITSVQVTARPSAPRIKTVVAHKISGGYDMSNGWYLRVHPGPRFIDAIIDDQPPLRQSAVPPHTFVSGDANVTMQFNRGEYGDEMEMSYRPDRRLAERIVISSRVAQR